MSQDLDRGPSDATVLDACRQFLSNVPDDLNYILPLDLHRVLCGDPESLFLLDNRTPDAYAAGHIPGSVNIWLKDLLNPEQIARLPRDREIIVCCWVGHTSSQVLTILQLLGFRARGLKYGIGTPKNPNESTAGWTGLGLPLREGELP
jgi:rhodanese-related sulfurtransferase